jgi:hypothetical protein
LRINVNLTPEPGLSQSMMWILTLKLDQVACEFTPCWNLAYVKPFTPIGSGKVYRGYWYGTLVALKTLDFASMLPTPQVRPIVCMAAISETLTPLPLQTIEREVCVSPPFLHPMAPAMT